MNCEICKKSFKYQSKLDTHLKSAKHFKYVRRIRELTEEEIQHAGTWCPHCDIFIKNDFQKHLETKTHTDNMFWSQCQFKDEDT